MIAVAAAQLLSGAPAETAIATLRQTYKTDSSLSSAMSRVRARLLARNEPPAEYDPSALRALATPEISTRSSRPVDARAAQGSACAPHALVVGP